MNLKLGMVITQINSIVQKKKRFVAIATCLLSFYVKGL